MVETIGQVNLVTTSLASNVSRKLINLGVNIYASYYQSYSVAMLLLTNNLLHFQNLNILPEHA
jgi:hypothetical protein